MTLSLCVSIAKTCIWNYVRFMFRVTQVCFRLVTLHALQIWRSKRPGNYSWSAHVQSIWFRHKFDLVVGEALPSNFIATHHSFQSPEYVLQDHVTLYGITSDEAIFVETERDFDVLHSDAGCFLRVAQFLNAKRVIKMPMTSFHKLAQQVGDPKGKMIFVSNTTRCGSTLLSQFFEETGRVLSFSEPHALNTIGLYKDAKVATAKLDRIVIDAVRMLCKPISRPISAYLLKTTGPTIEAVPEFIRIFPESKHLFMYRNAFPMTKSCYKTSKQLPLLDLVFLVTPWSQTLTRAGVAAMGLSADMFKVRCSDGMVFCLYVWAVIISRYREYVSREIDIVAVKYEDLVERPLEATRTVFKYCGVPVEWAEQAINALKKDAQRLSPLSRKNLDRVKLNMELTPQRKREMNAICDQFGLPRIPQECVLERTITSKN